jgi:hypothetical protein
MRHPFRLLCALGLGLGLTACSGDDDDVGKNQPSSGGSGGSSGSGGSAQGGSSGDGGSSGNPNDSGTGGSAGTDGGIGGSAGSDAGTGWTLPNCTAVTGTGAVTFTHDEGATLATVSQPLIGINYTRGLIAQDVPNTLLAASKEDLLRSQDAGCTWSVIGTLPSSIMTLVKGVGERAYAYDDNYKPLVRIDGTTITPLKSPADVIGMQAHPTDPDRVRIGGSDAQVWDSTDGGATWDPIGVPASTSNLLLSYRFVFDPQNLDHILFGSATDGAVVSMDGGASWIKSTGLSPSGKANAFEIAISPVDPNVVWLEGIDLDENLANATNEGRHIWRSDDAGLSFTRVVEHDAANNLTLTNGCPLVPHPTNKNVVYFEFGTYFSGYGTDIYKYDGTGVTKTHNAYNDILAFAFNPSDPSLMYLGITQASPN